MHRSSLRSNLLRILPFLIALCPLAASADDVVEDVNEVHGEVQHGMQGAAEEAGMGKVVGGGAYGPAGCGLGSLIFDADSGFTQIFAATTNGSFGNQTFAITSGTSNCADSSGGTASAKAFIQANREAFSKDVARGSGETITNLSLLAGCADQQAVGAVLQKNFSAVFPNAGASDQSVSDATIEVLRSDTTLACGQLG